MPSAPALVATSPPLLQDPGDDGQRGGGHPAPEQQCLGRGRDPVHPPQPGCVQQGGQREPGSDRRRNRGDPDQVHPSQLPAEQGLRHLQPHQEREEHQRERAEQPEERRRSGGEHQLGCSGSEDGRPDQDARGHLAHHPRLAQPDGQRTHEPRGHDDDREVGQHRRDEVDRRRHGAG